MDDVSWWWGSVVGIAAHWLAGDDDAANKLYPTVDCLPKALANTESVFQVIQISVLFDS